MQGCKILTFKFRYLRTYPLKIWGTALILNSFWNFDFQLLNEILIFISTKFLKHSHIVFFKGSNSNFFSYLEHEMTIVRNESCSFLLENSFFRGMLIMKTFKSNLYKIQNIFKVNFVRTVNNLKNHIRVSQNWKY